MARLDTLHHREVLGVCRVVLSEHSFFAIQCLESLIVESATQLVKSNTTNQQTDLSLNVANCLSMALN
jgi:hypothetical protein